VAGGTGWINGRETLDARVWNSESDGQHSDPDVQRQFCADTDVKLRAMVRRGVRRNMTAQSIWGVERFDDSGRIYKIDFTTCREQSPGEINLPE